ncbi:MAG: hypothetical protein OSB25_04805 [Salibacteraceae bacterium]|nr:hypothetical protein [Salibacteraceae bacterium]
MPNTLNKFYNDLQELQKTAEPHIGIIKAYELDFEYRVQGDRKNMKILPIPVNEVLPLHQIKEALQTAMIL